MSYAIFEENSSRLVCMGPAEFCEQELGLTPGTVEKWARYPGVAGGGFTVMRLDSSNPMRCPCENCVNSPRTKGVVSASCEKPECRKWSKWAVLYWNRLRRKYLKR